MVYPGARPAERVLYSTAKRVVDEEGKGQEVLRFFTASLRDVANAAEERVLAFIPPVDIVIVGVTFACEGVASLDLVNLIAPIAYDTAVGVTNRLVTAVAAASVPDDVVFYAALSGLNGNVVAAGQPIMLVCLEVGSDSTPDDVFVQVNYILADEQRSY